MEQAILLKIWAADKNFRHATIIVVSEKQVLATKPTEEMN